MADPGMPSGPSVPDWMLAAEAAAWLVLAGVMIRSLAFAQLARAMGAPARVRLRSQGDAVAGRVGWAVAAAARRAPWGPKCFEQGLAAHAMLRVRGAPSTLVYGARLADPAEDPSGLLAHVWVRSGDRDVVGGPAAAGFAALARFPPEDAESSPRRRSGSP